MWKIKLEAKISKKIIIALAQTEIFYVKIAEA